MMRLSKGQFDQLVNNDGTSKGKSKGERSDANDAGPRTFITPGHVRCFQAITSQLYDNITLWSCYINGEPGVAIVMVDRVGEDKLAVMPLFVAVTENMDLDFGDGESGSDDGGGGPKRSDAARDFEVNKSMLTPGGSS